MSSVLGRSGIRVNSVSPGVVLTPQTAPYEEKWITDISAYAKFPTHRLQKAESVVRTLRYFVENEDVNGVDIKVDAGWVGVLNYGGEKDPRELAPGML